LQTRLLSKGGSGRGDHTDVEIEAPVVGAIDDFLARSSRLMICSYLYVENSNRSTVSLHSFFFVLFFPCP